MTDTDLNRLGPVTREWVAALERRIEELEAKYERLETIASMQPEPQHGDVRVGTAANDLSQAPATAKEHEDYYLHTYPTYNCGGQMTPRGKADGSFAYWECDKCGMKIELADMSQPVTDGESLPPGCVPPPLEGPRSDDPCIDLSGEAPATVQPTDIPERGGVGRYEEMSQRLQAAEQRAALQSHDCCRQKGRPRWLSLWRYTLTQR